MSVLGIDLYSKIISNGPIRVLQNYKMTTNGGDLEWAHHLCHIDGEYFFKRKNQVGWYNDI